MKFATVAPLFVALTLGIVFRVHARAANDGKYDKRRYSSGKYMHTNEGDYVEDLERYRYVHYDDGDRGRYIHVHVPYDGGYGNYEGGHEPYRNPPYDATGLYAYVQRPRNESCLRLLEQYYNTCSDSSADNPFKVHEYDIKQPNLYLEYGTPYPEFNFDASSKQEKQTLSSAEPDARMSNFPGIAYLPVPEPSAKVVTHEGKFSEAASRNFANTFDHSTITLTTVSQGRTQTDYATNVPEDQTSTALPRKTSSQSVTSTPFMTTASSTTPASVELQLQQCRVQLESALLKLSHDKVTERNGRMVAAAACQNQNKRDPSNLALVGCALAQTFRKPVNVNVNVNDGRYYGDDRGKYNDGKYRPDNSGAYRPDDSGKYSGSYDPYLHGKYGVGGQGGAGGAGSGFGGKGGQGGAGSGAGLSAGFGKGTGGNKFGTGVPAKVVSVVPVVAPPKPLKLKQSSSGSGEGFDRIKEQLKEYNEDGYYYRYLTEKDTQVAETGRIEERNTDNETLRAKGFFEYVGTDGVQYRVDYTADENGFVPVGAHLPVAPPVPEQIARALEYVRRLQQ
ncbi:uncharacterized protein LOC129773356 [Toxorhynchites rutilus septentrionalis]|uniref:uncharacterized protein LOC129773356 n=1 Tax=Toxorhynchites rutilus septentrionalis TaxID=329112 RepID=UPI002478F743|nr:uncharacterized protein LOC129773356 [Toxorhynchites rutilus septentrionalis]